MKQNKKNKWALLGGILTLTVGLFTVCGQEGNQVELQDYQVSSEAKSGLSFVADYDAFATEEWNLIYTDALDSSYYQTLKVVEKPEDMNWQEVVMNSDASNVADFQELLVSEMVGWQTAVMGEATLEYLSVSDGENMYSLGVFYLPEGTWGVLIYGNFDESRLLENAANYKIKETEFSVALDSNTQKISFSQGGLGSQICHVQFFETKEQVEAYFTAQEKKVQVDTVLAGEPISFAGLSMSAISFKIGADGQVETAGDAAGTVYAEGIISLDQQAGFLLVSYIGRETEGTVEGKKEMLLQMSDYFALDER